MYNKALKDAFFKTNDGKAIAIQAKKQIRGKQIAERIRRLKNLAYSTFIADVPAGKSKRWDIYRNNKSAFRNLGKKGGAPYERALSNLKYVWIGDRNEQKLNYKTAIEYLESWS
jgi:hypothetical protein